MLLRVRRPETRGIQSTAASPCAGDATRPCHAIPAGVAEENSQAVLRVSNRVTLAQCWFNEDRTKKPQTFAAAAADAAAAFDPLAPGGSGACDFCNWQQLTAEDTWGRVEGPHAVSASNLFKYVKPQQGELAGVCGDPALSAVPEVPPASCHRETEARGVST